jgi:hypothetical protein
VYTVVLWSVQFYWKFAIIIALTSVVAISASVWETRRVSVWKYVMVRGLAK